MPHVPATSRGTLKKCSCHLHWRLLKSCPGRELALFQNLSELCQRTDDCGLSLNPGWLDPGHESSHSQAAWRIVSIPQLCSHVLLSLFICPCSHPPMATGGLGSEPASKWTTCRQMHSGHLLHRDFSGLEKCFSVNLSSTVWCKFFVFRWKHR